MGRFGLIIDENIIAPRDARDNLFPNLSIVGTSPVALSIFDLGCLARRLLSPTIPPQLIRTHSEKMDEPGMCECCVWGHFIRMQSHLKKCGAAKRRGREATTAFQELTGQGWKPTGEPLWKQPRFDCEMV